MHKQKKDVFALASLGLLVAACFVRLFFPVPQLVVTPDFGRSDAWHFSFPTKYVLSRSLGEGQLPLWRNDIGDGFPLFGEGQTGALYLPNIILFRMFDAVTAYNLALAVAVLSLSWGMYWWLRVLRLDVLPAAFGSLVMAFNGLAIAQFPHITLLQGMSLMPAAAAATTLLATRRIFPWFWVLITMFSQQIFAGFPQSTFLTIVLAATLIARHTLKTRSPKAAAYFIGAVITSLLVASVQLLPSWEFLQQSTHPEGFDVHGATQFSMPLRHLITFIRPYALGNPKTGTYPPFYEFSNSIFWENIGYIGILPLGFAVASLRRIRRNTAVPWFTAILALSLLMAWGAHSPLYVLYGFWPLNVFRVPSRFLWISISALVVLSAHGLAAVLRTTPRKWAGGIAGIIFLVHGVDIAGTWWSYHLIQPASGWLSVPQTAALVEEGRIATVGESLIHNAAFFSAGWDTPAVYNTLRMGLSPDSNMLWDIRQHDVYAGRFLKRPSLVGGNAAIQASPSATTATVSAFTRNTYAMSNVSSVVSFLPLTGDLTLKETVKHEGITAYVYSNPSVRPRARLADTATQAATLAEAMRTLDSGSFISGDAVLLERHEIEKHPELAAFTQPQSTPSASGRQNTVTIIVDHHDRLVLDVANPDRDRLLVLADTNYPGWTASVDGQETAIFTANLMHRAVLLPKGDHLVIFRYAPISLRTGSRISITAAVLIIGLVVVQTLSQGLHTPQTPPEHAAGRRRNRGT